MKTRRWTRLLLPSILAAALPPALVAQGVRVVPIRVSMVAPRWLGNPVESSNGRFVATTSDSAIYLFDRDLKRWDSLTIARSHDRADAQPVLGEASELATTRPPGRDRA
jgi:hypothetical protein